MFQWSHLRHSHPHNNLMQVPEELSNPRRVVAAEQEDSSWHSMLAYLHCEYRVPQSIMAQLEVSSL